MRVLLFLPALILVLVLTTPQCDNAPVCPQAADTVLTDTYITPLFVHEPGSPMDTSDRYAVVLCGDTVRHTTRQRTQWDPTGWMPGEAYE